MATRAIRLRTRAVIEQLRGDEAEQTLQQGAALAQLLEKMPSDPKAKWELARLAGDLLEQKVNLLRRVTQFETEHRAALAKGAAGQSKVARQNAENRKTTVAPDIKAEALRLLKKYRRGRTLPGAAERVAEELSRGTPAGRATVTGGTVLKWHQADARRRRDA